MQVKALEASCSSTAVSDPEEVVFESECRLRDYAIVLGNEYLDFQSIVSDSYNDELVIGGTVVHTYATVDTVAYLTLIDYPNCISKFYKRISNIDRVTAVLRDRITTNSYYYMVGYDASYSEYIFRFDSNGDLLARKFTQSLSTEYSLPQIAQYTSWIVVTSSIDSKIIDFDATSNPTNIVKEINFIDEEVLTTVGSETEFYYIT